MNSNIRSKVRFGMWFREGSICSSSTWWWNWHTINLRIGEHFASSSSSSKEVTTKAKNKAEEDQRKRNHHNHSHLDFLCFLRLCVACLWVVLLIQRRGFESIYIMVFLILTEKVFCCNNGGLNVQVCNWYFFNSYLSLVLKCSFAFNFNVTFVLFYFRIEINSLFFSSFLAKCVFTYSSYLWYFLRLVFMLVSISL